jgi:N,N-dimethylformamidase
MAFVMGYADRRSVRAGERIEFKVSCDGFDSYRARIVRLLSPQVFPGPDFPDFRLAATGSAIDGTYPARVQEFPAGSYGWIAGDPHLARLGAFTLATHVMPTTPGRGEQILIGTWSPATGRGVALALDDRGRAMLILGQGASPRMTVTLEQPLAAHRWVFLAASFDPQTNLARISVHAAERHLQDTRAATQAMRAMRAPDHAEGPLLIAAAANGELRGRPRTVLHFNGRLERPLLLATALDEREMAALAAAGAGREIHPHALGDWEFARDIAGDRISDLSVNARHGVAINMPTRAVTGTRWTGARHDWCAVPEEYAAIHFHDDDMIDARWATDFTLEVPLDWPSACYAARLQAGDQEFFVPFFVRPRQGEEGKSAKAAFLVPTCTYAAYANFKSRVTGRWNELYHGRLTVLDRTDWLMVENPGLAASTYDPHNDGSPIVYATMLQPTTNFRPTGRIYKFCQDLLLIDWLERSGTPYEIVTDDDLHREGEAALAPYACVFTGSHPEYWTTAMLDALERWVGGGGRFMYLGGNGFYWRTAFHPTLPGVVEVRRKGAGFLGPTAVAEGQFSLTGEVAGTWASVGRPPQMICGVGFVTQGFDACEGYRRHAASRDSRASFIFEGVTRDIVGDFGMLMGGAAGYEIDRADAALGTPAHALVVASSFDHSNIYDVSVSSFMDLVPRRDPSTPEPIRADMVFFETRGGGAVFSVGSIAWCGSLAHNNYDNDIARITANVLRRFVDPTPFAIPRL